MFVFLRLSLLCIALLWFPSAWKRWTHGFRPAKCAITWPHCDAWTASDPDPYVLDILKGNFTYWTKGAQSYVFLSEDRKYVLKLFRFDASRLPYGQEGVRWLRQKRFLKEKHFLPWQTKVVKTLTSCHLAYAKASDLTGVIWVHLNVGERPLPTLIVTDRLGRAHRIDPARFRFALQKRADSFLSTLQKAKNPQPCIASFFSLLDALAERGLANIDPNMGKNFGFLDGKAVEIDFGNFLFDPALAAQDKAHFAHRLKRWVEKNRPEFSFMSEVGNPI